MHRQGVDVRLAIYPRVGSVALSGGQLWLYDLDVEGLEALADYSDPEEVAAANMPTWTSRARIHGMALVDGRDGASCR